MIDQVIWRPPWHALEGAKLPASLAMGITPADWELYYACRGPTAFPESQMAKEIGVRESSISKRLNRIGI